MFTLGTPAEFQERSATLVTELKTWFDQETAAIDGSIISEAPAGDGGSIIDYTPAIDSKRMLDASFIVEDILGFELPPEAIQPGGYGSFEEMVAHLLPQLEMIFVGTLTPKKSSHTKTTAVEEV